MLHALEQVNIDAHVRVLVFLPLSLSHSLFKSLFYLSLSSCNVTKREREVVAWNYYFQRREDLNAKHGTLLLLMRIMWLKTLYF